MFRFLTLNVLDYSKGLFQTTEDITELNDDLKKYKLELEELNFNNRDMNMQQSNLAVELRDKETAINANVNKCLHEQLKLTILVLYLFKICKECG